MEKKTILISAVGGDIGSGAVKALVDQHVRVVGTDMTSFTPVLKHLEAFYQSPPASDVGRYTDFLADLIGRKNIHFVLPISEPEIVVMNDQRGLFESLGVKLLLNNKFIVSNFLDKLKTAQFLEKLGIRVPNTALLTEYDDSWAFPLIVKARRGCGSKSLWIAEGPADIEYLRNKDDGALIVQEYLGSEEEEYTTGVFSDGRNVSSITFRRKLGYGGLSKEVELVENPLLEDLCDRIACGTKLIGSLNVQTRNVDNLFVPFEINPRLSSTLLFRREFGFDDTNWWMDVLSGNGYHYTKKYTSGRAIRCVTECFFDMKKA